MNEKEIYKFVCINDLAFYTRQAFKVLEPEKQYEHNWHIDVISQHLEAVYKQEIKNLNINIPPRTIKSVLVNIVFPTWVWLNNPSYKFISASYSDFLSVKFNMKRREIIKSKFFQDLRPLKIKEDADQQRFLENEFNGFFLSTSVGGAATGLGADILLTDDILNVADGYSETKRDFANEWYASTFFNRLQDKKTGRRINVMQRVHENDLSGFIKKTYDFEHLVIPMQKELDQVQTSLNWTDPRKEGEFLHPIRYAENEKLEEIKGLGAYGWSGQMQQRPSPISGGIIKKEWIKFVSSKQIPNGANVLSIDATFKNSKESDYVAMSVLRKVGANFYLIDAIRGKWDLPETLKRILVFYGKHNPTKVLIEDKANGPAIISILKSKISGIKAINPKDSKEARVHAVAYLFECGNVFINEEIEIKDDIIHEFVNFPKADHDDLVDTITQGLSEMSQHNESFFVVGKPLGV
jgi:predicted phage terminase large subunit-like protein